jgi:hypothetical protein
MFSWKMLPEDNMWLFWDTAFLSMLRVSLPALFLFSFLTTGRCKSTELEGIRAVSKLVRCSSYFSVSLLLMWLWCRWWFLNISSFWNVFLKNIAWG